MKLLVDMGNSTMKWATISDGLLSHAASLSYEKLTQQLDSAWQSLNKPESIVVSCVAHEQQWQELSQFTDTLWGMTPERIISPGKGNGVTNIYQQPENLGSDRWAALVAAHELYDSDVCIVDCGTALTIDLLSANGQHLGGVIVPGAQMMQNSLHLNTAALPQPTSDLLDTLDQQYWGQDTQSGIIKGSWLALAGVVRQVHEQYAKQSEKLTCILCGGGIRPLLAYLAKDMDVDIELEPVLVLKGLALIAGEKIKA